MSAHQLRRVGTRGVWLDPAAVIAIAPYRSEVIVLLAGGERIVASTVDPTMLATAVDVERLVDELTAVVEDPDVKPWPVRDPADRWDQNPGE